MRPRCDGCARPLGACLCPAMPLERLRTRRTHLIIMQHPLEARHKLTTVPVLARCLHPDSCEVLTGRQFRKGCSSLLDQLIEKSSETGDTGMQTLLLYPAPDSTNLAALAAENENQQDEVLLLVVDATWQHAKEMIKASMPFLKDRVVQVALPFDKHKEGLGMGGTDLTLRKEPFDGFLTTMEAAARALGYLEPEGAAMEQALLRVLKRMVSMQTVHVTKQEGNHADDRQRTSNRRDIQRA